MELEEKRPLYRQQIKAVEPDLEVETWQENREGLVNDVVIVNQLHVFRFPQNDSWAVDDLWAEANVLTLLRDYVEMPLPRWSVYDGNLIGHPFAGYQMIQGKPLQRFELFALTEPEQDGLAEQIATFLRQMHGVPMVMLEGGKIRPSVTNRSREKRLALYEDVQRELFPYLMSFQKEWVHHHFKPIVENAHFMDYEPAMMNGDLGNYHLLYNPTIKRLNGIIDFGTAGIGDPAADIACLLDQYGESFVQRINRHYNIEHLFPRARFWSGTLRLQWALGGLRNPDDLSWFFVHLGRARDVYEL